jgi:eukaryotic-like serine/threonine-protein kinase
MPSDPTPSDPPGRRRLGRYVLLRRLAVGGMAEVFEARPEAGAVEGAAPVVIKALLPQLARDAELVRMMEHEADLSAELSHPNLVGLVELGSDGGLPFLVLERVDGLSLDRLLAARRGAPIGRDVAALVVADLLRALGFLHAARGRDGQPLGVVHRDVSPQNLLLSRRGEVKLGDLGIARSARQADRTRTGVIKGKLRYLAPEQATGSSVDGRTDLYGAGLVLWELVAGEPYVRGEGEIELLRAAEAPPPRRLDDPALDAVARRALARFPEERYQRAEAFLHALEQAAPLADPEATRRALAGLVVEALELELPHPDPLPSGEGKGEGPSHDVGGPTRALSPAKRSGRRWPIVIGLGVAAALALVSAIAIPWAGRRPPRTAGDEPPVRVVTAIDAAADAAGPVDEPAAADASPGSTVEAEPAADADRAPVSPRRPHGAPLAAAPRDAGATPPTEAGPAVEPGRAAEELSRRVAALRAELARRGIQPADLDAGQREALREAEALAAQGRRDEAGAALARLEPELAAVRVDQDLLRRKLARVDARLAAARRGHAAGTAAAEDLAATALQDFMDGRYDAANRRLNQILQIIGD